MPFYEIRFMVNGESMSYRCFQPREVKNSGSLQAYGHTGGGVFISQNKKI